MRASCIVAGLYILLCAGALLLVPASAYGWLGVEPDPLSGVFAFVLALPWVMLATALTAPPMWLTLAIMVLGMAINVAIILAIGRWLARAKRA